MQQVHQLQLNRAHCNYVAYVVTIQLLHGVLVY